MRTTALRPMPKIRFRDEQEEELYTAYVNEWLQEFPELSPPQKRQLEKAGYQYILGLRLVQEDLTSGLHHLNTRYSHLQEEDRVLSALGLNRKDSKVPTQGKYTDEELAILELAFANKDRITRR
jgi:hypothetical protein